MKDFDHLVFSRAESQSHLGQLHAQLGGQTRLQVLVLRLLQLRHALHTLAPADDLTVCSLKNKDS